MRNFSRVLLLGFSSLCLTAVGCAAENDDADDGVDEGALSDETRFYLSDLDALRVLQSGHGPIGRDQSNGELPESDGKPIKIRGHRYNKGLGVHAPSEVRLDLDGKCSRFYATVGIDDEVAPNGSATFEVWADGAKLLETGTLTGTSAPQSLSVNVVGKKELALIVKAGSDNAYDHTDWANARVFCTEKPVGGDVTSPPSSPPPTPPSSPSVDLFDEGLCAGTRISLYGAKSKFAPGTTTADLGRFQMAVRKRACHEVTGCGAWESFDKMPYELLYDAPAGRMSKVEFFPLVSEGDSANAWFAAKTNPYQRDDVRLRLSYVHGTDGVDLNLRFNGTGEFSEGGFASWVGPCAGLGCPGTRRNAVGGQLDGYVGGNVTSSCMRLVRSQRDPQYRTSVTWTEYQTVFYAHY